MGTNMLFMFRLLLVAAGMVIVALAMTARGLVPEPEVRTRIGEVPSIGRALVQQAIAPPTQIARLSIDRTVSEANRLSKVVAEPLAELVASAPTSETASIPLTTEPASTGEPEGVVFADAPTAADPPALAFGVDPEASRRTESVAGERSATAPSKPPLNEDRAPAGGSTKAKAPDSQSGSESATPAHSGKGKKSATETRRKTAKRATVRTRKAVAKANAERKVAMSARKRVKNRQSGAAGETAHRSASILSRRSQNGA